MKSFATFIFCLLISTAAAAQSVQPAPPVSAEQMAAIAPHSPQWAPVFQPTVNAAITAEMAVLMDLLGG